MMIPLLKPQTTPAIGGASLDELKLEIIRSSRRGYPILLAGALFFAILAVLPALAPLQTVRATQYSSAATIGMDTSISPLAATFSRGDV